MLKKSDLFKWTLWGVCKIEMKEARLGVLLKQ